MERNEENVEGDNVDKVNDDLVDYAVSADNMMINPEMNGSNDRAGENDFEHEDINTAFKER